MVVEIAKTRSKEAVEEDVQRLRDWLDKQPHLPHHVEHDLLVAFVNGTNTLELTKCKLDAYFSNRNRYTKLFDENGRNVNAQFREKSRAFNQFFLKDPTPEGYRVFFISVTDFFVQAFDQAHEATRMLMMLELSIKIWPENPGGYVVFDCANMPSSIITKLSPAIIASAVKSFQDGYPIKTKGIFCINAPPFIEFVVNNLFKPAVKAKLFKRIKIFKEGASSLKEYLPLEMLPSTYGGNDKSTEELNDYWLNKLEENREWFLLSTKQVSDEKKRPPDSQNTYGIEGTFRKLAVD